jgi:hypothetical protein
MNILEAILQAQGGGAVQQMGRQFGLSDDQTKAALATLVPALAAGLQRNMASPQGLDGLLGALSGGQHQQYVEDPSVLGAPATVADGNGILAHILGSKDVSRQLASSASARTGIAEGVLKSMLPVVAALMMGAMSRRMAQPGGMQAGAAGGTDLLGMLTPLLDSNRDGSIVDDVMGIVGRMFSGR